MIIKRMEQAPSLQIIWFARGKIVGQGLALAGNSKKLQIKGEINMKCCLKIITMIGILAGGILLVDYKTNILMQGNNTGIMEKITTQIQKITKK